MTLRVSRTSRSVIVTMPPQCDLDAAGSFLNRHIEWVRERLCSVPVPISLAHDDLVPLRGEIHRINVLGRHVRGQVVASRQVDDGSKVLDVAGDAASAARRLTDWLHLQARADLGQRVAWHAKRLSVRPKRITVRDQTSRWGSCWTTGVLSFSWRLVLAPPGVLDYVAAHEVAHLAEMNHGPRFWSLVRATMPEPDAAKAWLKVYGADLHRYGAAA
jgi:predicted metal-dependent hydrolase